MEKIIPTVGLGTATEYDIPLDKVETEAVVEMDLTTKIACLDDNENIPESAAAQSSSARESQCNCLLRQRSPYQLSSKNVYKQSEGSGISKSMKDNRPHPFQRVQLSIRFKLYVHLTDQNYSVICKYGNNCQDRLSISVRGGLV